MNRRWTLRLLLLGAGAVFPALMAAFVTPDPRRKSPRANALFFPLEKSASTHLFSQESSQETEEADASFEPVEESSSQPIRSAAPSEDGSSRAERQSIGISYDKVDAPSKLSQQPNTDPFRADFRDLSEPKLMTTFGGGTALMFEMIAERMLDWGNEAKPYVVENENGESTTTAKSIEEKKSSSVVAASSKVLPRWHPHSGISNANPNFRSQAPAMSNQGE
jgi:hypothetical protein